MDARQPFDLMDLATSYGGSDEVMQLALVALTSYSVFRGYCITIQFQLTNCFSWSCSNGKTMSPNLACIRSIYNMTVKMLGTTLGPFHVQEHSRLMLMLMISELTAFFFPSVIITRIYIYNIYIYIIINL